MEVMSRCREGDAAEAERFVFVFQMQRVSKELGFNTTCILDYHQFGYFYILKPSNISFLLEILLDCVDVSSTGPNVHIRIFKLSNTKNTV